jgi:rubredoxin
MKQKYRCKDCKWIGTREELDYQEIESCMNIAQVEACPSCGSMFIEEIDDPRVTQQT